MNQMEFEKFQEILGGILQVEPAAIQLNQSFAGSYGADSLSLFQILLALETEFGIIIEEKELEQWNKVEDVWRFLCPDEELE